MSSCERCQCLNPAFDSSSAVWMTLRWQRRSTAQTRDHRIIITRMNHVRCSASKLTKNRCTSLQEIFTWHCTRSRSMPGTAWRSRSLHRLIEFLPRLIHLTTKDGAKTDTATLLFPFIYDMGKKICLGFRHLQLLSKYVSHRAFQTEHRPVPPLTDPLVTRYPANQKVMIEANQRLVDNVTHSLKLRRITNACLV